MANDQVPIPTPKSVVNPRPPSDGPTPASTRCEAALPFLFFALLAVSFFGSLVLAAQYSPRPYDWRQSVMSSLASPRDNPHAYHIASFGLAFSGVLLAWWVFLMRRRPTYVGSRWLAWAEGLFLLGSIALTLSALVVPGHHRVLGIGRMHEHLAQIAGAAFCCALLLQLKLLLSGTRTKLLARVVAVLLVVLPVTAFLTSKLALFFATTLLFPVVAQRIKASLWSSLSLWEWVGSVCVFLFLVLLTFSSRKARIGE